MPQSKQLPQTIAHLGQSAESKLARTLAGRAVLGSMQIIVDTVKYEPGNPDRVWLGTSRTSVLSNKRPTLRAEMSPHVMRVLRLAVSDRDSATLNSVAIKLLEAFEGGANFCPFVLEDEPDV